MTGATSDYLSTLLNGEDGCCGQDPDGGGGCGKCLLVQNHHAVNSDWKVIVMKKNRCPECSTTSAHMDFSVPGYDHLQYSRSNICGDEPDTDLSKQ